MGALMDATACRVSRPREDAAMEEWRERGRETNAADGRRSHSRPRPRPSTHCSSPPATISRHLLRSSSASLLVVYSISHHPPPVPLPSERVLHSRAELPIVLARPRQSSPASAPALSLSSSPFPTTALDSDAMFSIPDRIHHFPHYTLPSSVSVPALSRLSSPTPTKAILAVVMLVLLP